MPSAKTGRPMLRENIVQIQVQLPNNADGAAALTIDWDHSLECDLVRVSDIDQAGIDCPRCHGAGAEGVGDWRCIDVRQPGPADSRSEAGRDRSLPISGRACCIGAKNPIEDAGLNRRLRPLAGNGVGYAACRLRDCGNSIADLPVIAKGRAQFKSAGRPPKPFPK